MRWIPLALMLCAPPLEALAQMPEGGPPPDAVTIDPRTQKRVEMLKKMGLNKARNPDSQQSETDAGSTPPQKQLGGMMGQGTDPNVDPMRDRIRAHRAKQFATIAIAARRGAEMKKHFQRMAKIERIEWLATQHNNAILSDKATTLRQKELARHQRVLAKLEAQKKAPPNFPQIDVTVHDASSTP